MNHNTDAKFDVEAIDRKVKIILLVASGLTLLFLLFSAMRENVFNEWRYYRFAYWRVLADQATDERGKAIYDKFSVLKVEQNVVPDLGVTDRCITCHAGLDDPRMADQQQPFKTHPGRYLELHDPSKYGCTVCHLGQGRAIETEEAHGAAEFWDWPMLDKRHVMTTCGRCHDSADLLRGGGLIETAAGTDEGRESARLIAVGKEIVDQRGCLGCHMLGGKGGNMGPDLSFEGEKTRHGFDFTNTPREEPRLVTHWLKKHFLDPKSVIPKTAMPNMGLSDLEAEALTAYMLAQRKKVIPGQYHRPSTVVPEAPLGHVLYQSYCSVCHGEDGTGNEELLGFRTPTLSNPETLAVADDYYLRAIIGSGRSGTPMPSWRPGSGNLTDAEIDKIIEFVRKWEPVAARSVEIDSKHGDPEIGYKFYHGLCANCHGGRGEGGIGISLNSLTMHAVATDRFLAETIINGRPGTAMPSWKILSAIEISDVLAYIKTWAPDGPSFEAVQAATSSDPDTVRAGEMLYAGNCAACHGAKGEGGIGLTLNTPSLLNIVDNKFLYTTIVEGRPSTAMPAWKHMPAESVGAIVAYMRSWTQGMTMTVQSAPMGGNSLNGEAIYETSCLRCHGPSGVGETGPQLSNSVLLASASNSTLFHWISKGRYGTAMRGFQGNEQGVTLLTDEQILDVIAYLRSSSHPVDLAVQRSGAGNPDLGGQIFEGNCASCHGPKGQGFTGPQLNNEVFLKNASDGFLAATMVLGRTDTAMRSMVHGQDGIAQVAPNEIYDVIAYIRLWDRPKRRGRGRPVAEMSERSIATGAMMFTQFCSGCHGPTGKGVREGTDYFAPALNNPEFLAAASDGFLEATIARGRQGTPMRQFGEGGDGIASLKAEDISDIVSFIRSWQESYKSKGDDML